MSRPSSSSVPTSSPVSKRRTHTRPPCAADENRYRAHILRWRLVDGIWVCDICDG
jgi:hypothetical protein